MEVVQHGAHRQNAVGVAQHGLDDVDAGHADGVVGGALAVDDLVRGVLDFLVDLLTNVGVQRSVARQRSPVAHRDATDGGGGPQRDFGVAVLTGDVGVHVLDVDAGLLADQEAQTSGIQVGAGAEHLVRRKTGDLLCDVGRDVDRVGDEHVDGVRGDLHQTRNDGVEDLDGGADQLQTGLARLLARTRGDDDHIGVAADLRVVGTGDGHGRVEAGAVLHVEHLGLDAFLGDVLEHDLAGDATLGGRESERGTDSAGTDDSELRGLN